MNKIIISLLLSSICTNHVMSMDKAMIPLLPKELMSCIFLPDMHFYINEPIKASNHLFKIGCINKEIHAYTQQHDVINFVIDKLSKGINDRGLLVAVKIRHKTAVELMLKKNANPSPCLFDIVQETLSIPPQLEQDVRIAKNIALISLLCHYGAMDFEAMVIVENTKQITQTINSLLEVGLKNSKKNASLFNLNAKSLT